MNFYIHQSNLLTMKKYIYLTATPEALIASMLTPAGETLYYIKVILNKIHICKICFERSKTNI
jgi:hypothetical protein